MASQSRFSALFPTVPLSTGDTSLVMDAAGEKVAFVVRIAAAGNVRKIHFRLGTVTTGQTLAVSLQNIDASGDPDGTPDQSGTVAVANSDDDTWKTVTLGSDRVVSAGDVLAVVIAWDSTAGNLAILAGDGASLGNQFFNSVYADHFTASWSKARSPIVILEYDDGSIPFVPGVLAGITTALDYGSGDTPDEVALKFQFPFPVSCHGIFAYGRLTGDADLVLYSTDGSTVLGTTSHDKDHVMSAGDAVFMGTFAPVALSANTNYYAAIKPSSATQLRLRYVITGTASHLGVMPGGANMYWSQQTNAGGWTDTTTRRPSIGLLLSAFDDGAGGGGGLAYPVGRAI